MRTKYENLTPVELANLQSHAGMLVYKPSGKPFKSTRKVNTVKGVMMHPITQRPCYTFEEDDTYVEVIKCKRWTPTCGVHLPEVA